MFLQHTTSIKMDTTQVENMTQDQALDEFMAMISSQEYNCLEKPTARPSQGMFSQEHITDTQLLRAAVDLEGAHNAEFSQRSITDKELMEIAYQDDYTNSQLMACLDTSPPLPPPPSAKPKKSSTPSKVIEKKKTKRSLFKFKKSSKSYDMEADLATPLDAHPNQSPPTGKFISLKSVKESDYSIDTDDEEDKIVRPDITIPETQGKDMLECCMDMPKEYREDSFILVSDEEEEEVQDQGESYEEPKFTSNFKKLLEGESLFQLNKMATCLDGPSVFTLLPYNDKKNAYTQINFGTVKIGKNKKFGVFTMNNEAFISLSSTCYGVCNSLCFNVTEYLEMKEKLSEIDQLIKKAMLSFFDMA